MHAKFIIPILGLSLIAVVSLSINESNTVESTTNESTNNTNNGLTLTSPAFADGGNYPVQFTCDGESISPPLSWSGIPEGTRSLAIIMDHNPQPKDQAKSKPEPTPSSNPSLNHKPIAESVGNTGKVPPPPPPKPKDGDGIHWYWIMYNIPVEESKITVGKSVGVLGTNSVNHQKRYTPPCSKGPGVKDYRFHIYALSKTLTVTQPSRVTESSLRESMRGLILDSDSVTVSFERKQRNSNEEKD